MMPPPLCLPPARGVGSGCSLADRFELGRVQSTPIRGHQSNRRDCRSMPMLAALILAKRPPKCEAPVIHRFGGMHRHGILHFR